MNKAAPRIRNSSEGKPPVAVKLGRGRQRAKTLQDAKDALYKEHIMDVAERIFAEQGFGNAKMQDIASEAGISLGRLYLSYPSKTDLHRNILITRDNQMFSAVLARGQQSIQAPESIEEVLWTNEVHLHFLLQHPDYLRMQLQEGHVWYHQSAHPTQEEQLMWDRGLLLLDLEDLRALLNLVAAERKDLSTSYGLVSAQSVGAIQRSLLQLSQQGAEAFFGEPALDLTDLLRTALDGRGILNVLAADQLVLKPRLYSSFLLWLLSELFERLPEAARTMRRDIESNFRAVLQSSLGRLDLTTREEFDVQTKVLERARERLEQLELRVAALEKRLQEHQEAVPPHIE